MVSRGETLHPVDGARFLLERRAVAAGEASATYAARIYTPNACFELDATLGPGGAAALVAVGKEAPADLLDGLDNLARSTARAAERRRGDDGKAAWPNRVLRWRGPGRG